MDDMSNFQMEQHLANFQNKQDLVIQVLADISSLGENYMGEQAHFETVHIDVTKTIIALIGPLFALIPVPNVLTSPSEPSDPRKRLMSCQSSVLLLNLHHSHYRTLTDAQLIWLDTKFTKIINGLEASILTGYDDRGHPVDPPRKHIIETLLPPLQLRLLKLKEEESIRESLQESSYDVRTYLP